MPIGNRERIVAALVVIAAVVAVNQTTRRGGSAVLGIKQTRCSVDAAQVTTGVRAIRAARLSVNVAKGKPASALVPPVKLSPGAPEPAKPPLTLELGVTPAGKGRITVVTSIRNDSDCSVAVAGVMVSARRGTATPSLTRVGFGGRERVVIAPGKRATARTTIPVPRDGAWVFDVTASADVGASA